MNVREFIKEINIVYPHIDKNKVVSEKIIQCKEMSLGYKIPNSFKLFLKEFSNGIMLLDSEPVGGVGEGCPCGEIFLASKQINKSIIEITPIKETISTDKLIVFSLYDAMDASNNCWVFICDKEYPDNEYRVGLISQATENIVVVLDNFEEWLTVFWKTNKDSGEIISVFHSIYPIWEQREILLGCEKVNKDFLKSDNKYLFDNKYYDVIYGEAWERKYEIEIQNLKTNEITKTVLPTTNGGRLYREEFEKNIHKDYKLVKFIEHINEKNISKWFSFRDILNTEQGE